MKNNLLRNAILSALIGSTLTACGVDEGLDYAIDSNEPVEMEGTSFTVTTNETNDPDDTNRYLTIDLVEGVSSKGISLTANSPGIFVQDTTELLEVSPVNRELSFGNISLPFSLSQNSIIVDTFLFSDEITSGEKAIYTFSYWINNGFEFTCDNMDQHPFNCTDAERLANPNRRTLILDINALPDPIQSLSLTDFSVPLDDTINAPITILPIFTAKQDLGADFTWSVPENNGIASVSNSGVLTGLALGSTTLTVTSIEMPSLTATVTITVNNSPKNVASISLTTPNGNEVASTISVPTCTSYNFNITPAKTDELQEFSGGFFYSYSSTETLPAVTFDADALNLNSITKQLPAYFLAENVGSSVDAAVNLNGTANSAALTIETLKNVMCEAAPMMNENFKMAAPQQNRDIFKSLNGFARNGVNADSTVDTTGSYTVVGMGKQGSDAIQFTAAAATGAISVLTAYDKNPERNINNVSLAAGGNFKVSFWIKNNNATSFKIENAIMKNTTKSFLPVAGDFTVLLLDQQGIDAIEIAANADWQLIELDVTDVAPFGADDRAKWDIVFVPSATDGSTPIDVYIDDISFAELSN